MDAVVLITYVQPYLLAWVGAISFFISLAFTALVSPNRQWFELAVIFAITLAVLLVVVGFIVQLVLGLKLIDVQAIQAIPTTRPS